jgi:hypothetical protein
MANIKKTFTSFINESKVYKLGDQYSSDYDYDGMVDMFLKISFDSSIEDLGKLKDSAVDVNYHTEARIISDIIKSIKEDDKEKFDILKQNILDIYDEDITESLEGELNGLLVSVFRPSDMGDTSANGLSSKKDRLMLVFEGSKSPFKTSEGEDYLVLIKRTIYGKEVLSAVPKSILDSGKHSMFGGNFIYTSDTRFPSDSPIKVHDRVEK